MGIVITQVNTKRTLGAFINFPFDLYKNCPNWVPSLVADDKATLNLDKNPAGDFCKASYWLAYKDNKIVGRIAGIINEAYIKKWEKKLARFGWFDVIEDYEVAKALLHTIETWAQEQGMEGVHGPLGFTDLDREGLLVEGFEHQATLATLYNYPYYKEYLEKLGYIKDVDWIEFKVKVPEEIPEKILRVNELIAKRSGVHVYEWKKSSDLVKKYGKAIFHLIDEAYASLYATTPLTEKQVQSYIKQYLGFVDPRFTKVIVDQEEKLIGFGITIPNLSDALKKSKGKLFPFGWYYLLRALKNPQVLDMYLVAVRPDYVSRGVVAIIMTEINRSAIDAGIKYAETNPELELNIAVQQIWKDYEKQQHKRRRIYIKKV